LGERWGARLERKWSARQGAAIYEQAAKNIRWREREHLLKTRCFAWSLLG